MKLGARIWILGIALAISIISIIAGSASTRFLIFALLIGILIVTTYFKSKPGIILVILIFLATAGFLISNSVESGVLVKSVDQNSPVFNEGLRQGEIIKSINNKEITDVQSYARTTEELYDGQQKRIDIKTKETEYTIFTNETLKLTVSEIPKTRIQTGLDLRGGSRALVETDVEISENELQDLIQVSRNRFNVYGLSDVQIKGITDLSGNKFMLVEVAGASPDDLEQLVSQQGKFEARIGNNTNKIVFTGGKEDISDVCRNDASCAGVTGCQLIQEGYACNFAFTIYLTEEAAERHAALTENLSLDETGQYLSERLFLYVDDSEVDSLLIGSSLRGQITTQISIQGSGTGTTNDDALKNAQLEMNRLQTILITGSLPYKLNIVKLDTISPTLGGQFIRTILIAGIAAITLVSLIVSVRYRKLKASLALLLTAFSELLIILGAASLIGWNIDLPSIAGILATIGTGVDQQIVILDEAGRGRHLSIKARMKRALFVIVTAYATTVASLIPLYWAGAGLFKGFALTTIIGITTGVLITRPAFADIIKKLES